MSRERQPTSRAAVAFGHKDKETGEDYGLLRFLYHLVNMYLIRSGLHQSQYYFFIILSDGNLAFASEPSESSH